MNYCSLDCMYMDLVKRGFKMTWFSAWLDVIYILQWVLGLDFQTWTNVTWVIICIYHKFVTITCNFIDMFIFGLYKLHRKLSFVSIILFKALTFFSSYCFHVMVVYIYVYLYDETISEHFFSNFKACDIHATVFSV